ncbi:MAG: amidase [Alphaproteobacteria bacterium]|nr:amidase [Alphaproteobacteria bacterium]
MTASRPTVAAALPTGENLAYAEISDLAALYRQRRLSPVDVTRATLDRIAAYDGTFHAFALVDPDATLSEAKRVAFAMERAQIKGPLAGIPIAVKDLCDVAGQPTAAGTLVWRDRVAAEDSTVVRRLREAGAIIVGRTRMAEAASGTHHPKLPVPVNPWNRTRVPGISSSGSAVALAAGLCAGAIGTDTGGSIRFPSAACNLTGVKPTFGRVSRRGVAFYAPSLDHVGPMARSAIDCAAMLTAMAGFDPEDPVSRTEVVPDYFARAIRPVGGVRIGIDEHYCSEGVDPSVRDAVLASAAVFAGAGAEIRSISLPSLGELLPRIIDLATAEGAVTHADTFPARETEYGPVLAAALHRGRTLALDHYVRLRLAGTMFAGRLAALFRDVDLILCPSWPVPPPPIDQSPVADPKGLRLKFTMPFNVTGNPTISMPCGVTPDGMPLSLQLIGRHLEEELLLRAGFAFQQASDWHRRLPDLH